MQTSTCVSERSGARTGSGWAMASTRGKGPDSAQALPPEGLHPAPRLGQYLAQGGDDELDLDGTADERRRELHHRVTPVVGPADEAGVEQGPGEVAPQQPLGLLVVKGESGLLVLDQLDPVEEAGAAHVADDGQVVEGLQAAAERTFGVPDVLKNVLTLEHVEVGQGDGATHGVAGEGETVQEGRTLGQEGLDQPLRGDHGAEGGIARG